MRERVFARKDVFIQRMLNVYQKNKIYCHLKRVGDGDEDVEECAQARVASASDILVVDK